MSAVGREPLHRIVHKIDRIPGAGINPKWQPHIQGRVRSRQYNDLNILCSTLESLKSFDSAMLLGTHLVPSIGAVPSYPQIIVRRNPNPNRN